VFDPNIALPNLVHIDIPPVHQMAYTTISKQLRIYMVAPWYNVQQFVDEVKSLRCINFSIVEQRQQALERINKLHSVCPFKANVRFPEHELYICEFHGDWARKLQQLKSALSYKDRDKEVFQSSQKLESSSRPDDASQAFWNATTAMLDQMTRGDGVFDRETFELYFKPTWH